MRVTVISTVHNTCKCTEYLWCEGGQGDENVGEKGKEEVEWKGVGTWDPKGGRKWEK